MQSTVKLTDYIAFAKEHQLNRLVLTDDDTLFGAYNFYELCLKHQVTPVIGMSIKVKFDDLTERVLIYCKNYQGYQALMELSSYTQLNKEPISMAQLKDYDGDIKIIVPDKFLLRKADQEMLTLAIIDQCLAEWPKETHIGLSKLTVSEDVLQHEKTVLLTDVCYLRLEEKEAYQALRKMDKQNNQDSADAGHHYLTQEELINQVPETLINRTNQFTQACTFDMPPKEKLLPKFPLPENQSPHRYLTKLCEEALEKRYGAHEVAKERLKYELAVINKMGFSDYFLIVSDFIRYARENQIMVGPGRGSAAGSIVSYLLNITLIDPLKYGLLFERFLNPERVTMPDIDIDFSDYGREKVIHYVKDKYGREHVAQIGTFGTFKVRSTIRELAKVYHLTDDTLQYILKLLPHDPSLTIARAVKESPDLLSYIKQSDELQRFFKIAHTIEDLPRNLSTHAAGLVIYHDRLTKHTPLTLDSEGHYLTQYNMTDLESIGLLKIDFLGLKNLTIIEQIVKDVRKKYAPDFKIEDVLLDDVKTYDLLTKGHTLGVFQLESKGMQETLTRLKPTHFEDIVAVNALYRPGPMAFIDTYIKRKEGREQVQYLHTDLAPILSDSYGVLIYQEQIIQVAHQFAGLTLGEADLLRRAVSKKNKQAIEKAKVRFSYGCLQKGYKPAIVEEVFSWILNFANYGFNRSHAVSYSMISYQLAFLKAHYPKSFYTALLNDAYGSQEKLMQYGHEVKRTGIKLLAPNVNQSLHAFTSEKYGIRMGLRAIKGLSYPVIDAIVKERRIAPYQSLYDFCLRVPLDIVKRKDIETLVLAGAFDIFNIERAALLQSIDAAIENGTLFGDIRGDIDWLDGFYQMEEQYPEVEPMPLMEKLSFEKALVGMYVSEHPLRHYRQQIRQHGIVSLSFLADDGVVKEVYHIVAYTEALRAIRTKRGESMAFLQLSDEDAEFDMVIFPEQYREYKARLEEGQFVQIECKLEERQGRRQAILQTVSTFSFDKMQEENVTGQAYYIQVLEFSLNDVLEKLQPLTRKYPGACPVMLYQARDKQLYKLKAEYYLKDHYAVKKQLIIMFGEANVKQKNI